MEYYKRYRMAFFHDKIRLQQKKKGEKQKMKVVGKLETRRKSDNAITATLYVEREFDEFHLTDDRYTCLGNVSEAIYIGTAPCNANVGDDIEIVYDRASVINGKLYQPVKQVVVIGKK